MSQILTPGPTIVACLLLIHYLQMVFANIAVIRLQPGENCGFSSYMNIAMSYKIQKMAKIGMICADVNSVSVHIMLPLLEKHWSIVLFKNGCIDAFRRD